MKTSKYLAMHFAAAVAACITLIALIYVADPYSLFGVRGALSLTEKKYFLSSFERISKPIIVCREKPVAVILGTSRAAVGLRPTSLAGYVGRTYNFGLNGSFLLEVDAALRVAAECGVKKVLYGVDFFTFTATTEERARQIRLMGGATSWEKVQALAKNIVSLSAVVDSLRTIWSNLRNEKPSHDGTGMFINYNPADVPFRAPEADDRRVFSDAYKIFDSMLVLAAEKDIDIRIFISPIFRSHLNVDEVYAEWLSRLMAISDRRGVLIHNVAGNPAFANQRTDFYDVSHYKPDVGDRIIKRIYAPREISGNAAKSP